MGTNNLSEEQLKRFGRLKYYGITENKRANREKPERGKLVCVLESGKEEEVPGCYDLPWKLLQYKKKCLAGSVPGYTMKNLKIKGL